MMNLSLLRAEPCRAHHLMIARTVLTLLAVVLISLVPSPFVGLAGEQAESRTEEASEVVTEEPEEVAGELAPPAGAAEAPSRRDVLTLAAEWQANQRQLANLNENYRQAVSPAERQRILADYERLVSDSRSVLTRLRSAAEARFRAAPHEDPQITAILVSFVSQDLQRDRQDAAWRLGELLTSQGVEAPELLDPMGRAAYHRDDFVTARSYLERAREAGTLSREGAGYLEDSEQAESLWQEELALRQREAEADDLPRVRLTTTKGEILLELFENEAPDTVGNFIHLVSSGFYEGSPFHRVLGNFMAQGGSNSDDGLGGPGYEIYCETDREDHRKHFRGSLSMAKRAEPNSGSSQFFLTFRRTSHLDGGHTVFGRVLEGWDVLENLQRRDPTRPGQPTPDRIVKAEVVRQRDHAYEPNKVR
jgi:cyclophilin family peptidyl-prolyl cis-trans isomerase